MYIIVHKKGMVCHHVVSSGSFDFVAQAGIYDILMGNKIGDVANKNKI